MIRRANEKDLLVIDKIGKEYDDRFSHLFAMQDYLNKEEAIVLVNDQDGVNGFIIAVDVIDNVDLLLIVVDENYRRRGIARDLMKYLIEQSHKPIMLEVALINTPAVNLYTKYNFKEVSRRKKYYNNEIDALVMRREV